MSEDDASGSDWDEPSSLQDFVAKGVASVGTSDVLRRGLRFAGNTLAARWGGASVYGGYSLGISTAGTFSNYFGLAIGSTAARFAGEHEPGSRSYAKVLRTLAGVAVFGALLAGIVMVAGAGPLSGLLLHEGGLTTLFRISALATGGMILFEGLTGVLEGLLEYKQLILYSLISGSLLLVVLAGGSLVSSEAMLAGHGLALTVTVLLALVLSRDILRFRADADDQSQTSRREEERDDPSRREILSFGGVQVSSGIGVSLASWGIYLLLTRSDPSLAAAGFWGVANQLKNLVMIVPGFLTPLVMPLLVEFEEVDDGEYRVLNLTTYLAASASLLVGSGLLIFLPGVLLIYGSSYRGALTAITILVGAGMLDMTIHPARQYLMKTNLRVTFWVNLVWPAILVALGWLWIPPYGVAGAAGAWLVADIASLLLTWIALGYVDHIPGRTLESYGVLSAVGGLMAAGALLRPTLPVSPWAVSGAMLLLLVLAVLGLVGLGLWRGYIPPEIARYIPGVRSTSFGG